MEETRYRDQSCELGASNKSSAIPKLGKLVDRRQKRLLFACRNSHRTPARLDARIFMRMDRFNVMPSSRGDRRCVRCRKLPLRRSKTKLLPCRRYAGSLDSGDWKTTSTISTDWLVQIFLEAYESIAQQHSWWISVPQERKILFDYFLLDKAFYELQYEMNHRPDWIGVPLGALQKMAGVMITP